MGETKDHKYCWNLFLVIGITLLLYPEIISYLKQKQSDQTVKELTQRRSKKKQDDLLYQKAVCYNRKIFKEKQAGLKDVFSYRSAPIVLRNEKNTFGYIKIPKMKQKLPLYLGATMENMRKGAAIMGQTSLPVGQKDSNCVIAAHRGYRGIPYFRDIEQLKKTGDQVIIRNLWERLDYRVTKIKVIDPYDMDKILIQKRKRYGHTFNLSSVPRTWKISVCGVLYEESWTEDQETKGR